MHIFLTLHTPSNKHYNIQASTQSVTK